MGRGKPNFFLLVTTGVGTQSDFFEQRSNNSDDLEDDCYESNSKQHDYQAPMQPNAHLYSYESSLDLPAFENCYGLDPKTQK